MSLKILYDIEHYNNDKELVTELVAITNALKNKGVDIDFYIDTFKLSSKASLVFSEQNGQNIELINFDSNELTQSQNESFFKILAEIFSFNTEVVTIKLFGITALSAEDLLSSIEKKYSDQIMCITYGTGYRTTVKVLRKNKDSYDLSIADIFTALKRYIYAEDEIKISERLIDFLKIRGKTLKIAESLTGGAVAKEIVDISGASDVLNEALVVYSNDAKINRLGVKTQTIASYGAVSSQTAYEMAAGLITSKNDFVIATTGIAGPTGGSLSKPVGLTFIAIGTPEAIHVYKHIFTGSRLEVRDSAVGAALFYSIRHLKDNGLLFDELVIE